MTDELKPCPFCGEADLKLYSDNDPAAHGFLHLCKIDGEYMVKVESRLFATEAAAIDAWNRRTPDDHN